MKIKLIRFIDRISTLCPCHPPKHSGTLNICLELSSSKEQFQPGYILNVYRMESSISKPDVYVARNPCWMTNSSLCAWYFVKIKCFIKILITYTLSSTRLWGRERCGYHSYLKKFFLLEYSWFTMLYEFQVHSKANQLFLHPFFIFLDGPLQSYWVEFPVLYYRSLLVIYGLPWWLSGQKICLQCRRQETWVRSLGQEDPLEKEVVTYSSTLAW